MGKINWLTEIISGNIKIFITPARYELAKEISKIIATYPAVEIVGERDEYNLLVYLSGFDKSSWSETVQYTSALHHHLDQALNRKAKFILVVPTLKSPFGQVAQSAVEQFGKNFKLNYLIVETGEVVNPKRTAQAVVAAFVKQPPPKEPPPKPPSELPKFLQEPQPLVKPKSGYKLIFTCLLLLLSPWLILGVLLVSVGLGMKCIEWSLAKQRWVVGVTCSRIVQVTASAALPLTVLTPGLSLEEPLKLAAALAPVLIQAHDVSEQLLPYFSALLDAQVQPPPDTHQLGAQLNNLNESLSYVNSQLQSTPLPQWMVGDLTTQFTQARKLVNQLTTVAPLLTHLQSATPTTWLVLLQDNSEIRPSGGFIDGIALITVEAGHITQTEFLSSQAADLRLRGQVTPPLDLRQALGENNWYLRDANWDPDFPASAARTAWFVQKEFEKNVDGVVAVNLNTLRQMLPVVGGITLTDFGGELTADNLWTNYFSHIQFDASQPRLLPLLAQSIYERSGQLSLVKQRQLAGLVLNGLETRQILLANLTQPNLIPASWRGELVSGECGSPYPCINQGVYLVDSNVGINKADASISRHLTVTVQVGATEVMSQYFWEYSHQGTEANWPGGNYQDWVRVYLPKQARVTQVKLGDTDLTEVVDQVVEQGLIKLSLPMQLVVGETQSLQVQFVQDVPKADRWHYQLSLPNQPGVAPYPVRLTVNYPSSWWTTTSLSPQIASSGSVEYNTLANRYLRWNLDLVPTP